ncbi:MAG: hypothetical protein A3I66_00765 [Burkholderiales bacterium RIFCSPLOWO2_02_FULL_57_36]|nr:MAG: hypothetical protein A3I66_00765 [Burkholderiales bacterium RIFCSPLOWO2_02_FULL_57_36]
MGALIMQMAAQTPLPAHWPDAEYTGTLLHAAETRTGVLDRDGHTVPVLCLDLELDNAMHTPLHVEQPFPIGHFAQAQAAAHRLKKGTRVTVQAPLVGMRLVARNATHIHVIPETTPDLFQEQAA